MTVSQATKFRAPARGAAHWADVPEGQRAILNAAVEAFSRLGYHNASMRDIRKGAGVSLSHLYYHFASKMDLLYEIMRAGAQDLTDELVLERDRAGDDPLERFSAMLRVHVRFHAERSDLALVGNTELRSLDPARSQLIIGMRDRVGRLFLEVVREGLAAGAFRTSCPREVVRAIMSMCMSVAGWYQHDGPDSPEAVAERYVTLALRVLDSTSLRSQG